MCYIPSTFIIDSVKRFEVFLPRIYFCATVEPEIILATLPTFLLQHMFNDIECHKILREHQQFFVACLAPGQNLEHHPEFVRTFDVLEVFLIEFWCPPVCFNLLHCLSTDCWLFNKFYFNEFVFKIWVFESYSLGNPINCRECFPAAILSFISNHSNSFLIQDTYNH